MNYARRQGGRGAYMNQSSFLPLKLNMSGVIPPIFASSIIMFPATASTWFGQSGNAGTSWLQKVSQMLAPGEPLHMVLLAALIMGFAFFYTALVFNSQETADNLKKSGALIPGIRPGKPTEQFLSRVTNRITLGGALFLGTIAVLPYIVSAFIPGTESLQLGGTSILIMVSVVVETMKQLEAQMMMRHYEGFIR